MAFQIRDLSVLAYANKFTHWHYRTTDSIADMRNIGYFADASDLIGVGDLITISCIEGVAQRGVVHVDMGKVLTTPMVV